MATLKICTHDRTKWIMDVQEVVLHEAFSVVHFDDPLRDCGAPSATRHGIETYATTVVDFQKPNPDESMVGDTIGHVLWVRRSAEPNLIHRVVAPSRSCFIMSDAGKTIDRI